MAPAADVSVNNLKTSTPPPYEKKAYSATSNLQWGNRPHSTEHIVQGLREQQQQFKSQWSSPRKMHTTLFRPDSRFKSRRGHLRVQHDSRAHVFYAGLCSVQGSKRDRLHSHFLGGVSGKRYSVYNFHFVGNQAVHRSVSFEQRQALERFAHDADHELGLLPARLVLDF